MDSGEEFHIVKYPSHHLVSGRSVLHDKNMTSWVKFTLIALLRWYQEKSLQNVSFWHVDYFELRAVKTMHAQEELLSSP